MPAALALALGAVAAPAAGGDGGAPWFDAAAPSADTEASSRIAQLRALTQGSLDVAIDPASLFDVPLSDGPASKLEAERLRLLLDAAERRAAPIDAAAPDAGPAVPEGDVVDERAWEERLALDRARLDFYMLPQAERDARLTAHAARVAAARPRETDEQRLAREAEAEREAAIAAARDARSEAERLVAEELARVLSVGASVTATRERIAAARGDLGSRHDVTLGWQRRARDAGTAGPAEADATFDALARALRGARDDLATALGELDGGHSLVPQLGRDPLAELPADVPTAHVRERRAIVARAIADARRDEVALRRERAAAALDEMSALQRAELALRASLSPDKRAALTGLTRAALEQAREEVRHLALVLRYHQRVALDWIGAVRADGSAAISPWRAVTFGLPLALAVACFAWLRRRTRALLRFAELRVRAADRAAGRVSPSALHHVVRVLSKTHGALEWIGFFTLVAWLLPADARGLLEVELLSFVATWILAGALTVNAVDALAATGAARAAVADTTAALRLRSLRFVGRTIVAFGLVLGLSARLVGAGTVHRWVLVACWAAALPVLLVLVRWWREPVFERLARARKKGRLEAWVLANRSGWRSFGAATVGAVHLFVTATVKTSLRWISSFDVARRVHAYLFRRGIARLGDGATRVELAPLSHATREQLHPARALTRWISCPSDALFEDVARRTAARRGGLIAVVGAQGMGKSSLLRAVGERARGEAVAVGCHEGMSLAEARACLAARPPVVLLDDAHALVAPCIGGLARFDELIALARANDDDVTWVFAFDASVWPFLQRARDARPLFDEIHALAPWDEAQIGALLADRCREAGVEPRYDGLLERLPPGSDELDRLDALRATRASYERMLWDHVGGNPGLALEAWRSSLAEDAGGDVHVGPLRVPDAAALEALPDSSLFILRAVLQLAPATVERLAEATRLRPEEVLQDIRFGQTLGLFVGDERHVRVAWPWLRAVTLHLARRRLLVQP